jgi:hypothetical protein
MSKLNHPPSSEQACLNCYYSRPSLSGGQVCRRMPPTPETCLTAWPRVQDADWCGEWAAREET